MTGTIRNLSDGRVEMVAEGVKEELDAFLQGVMDSGLGSLIRDAHTSWSEGRGDIKGFAIVN